MNERIRIDVGAAMAGGRNDGLDGAQTYGLAIILETCAAALRQMGEVKA